MSNPDPWAKLCVGRPCIRCGADDGTIVPAHANQIRLGKGMGIKAEPWTVIPLCLKCHTWLDNGKAERLETLEAYTHGWNRHMANLLADGLIELRAQVNPKAEQMGRLSELLGCEVHVLADRKQGELELQGPSAEDEKSEESPEETGSVVPGQPPPQRPKRGQRAEATIQ